MMQYLCVELYFAYPRETKKLVKSQVISFFGGPLTQNMEDGQIQFPLQYMLVNLLSSVFYGCWLCQATLTKFCYLIQENAALKIAEIGVEPDRQTLTVAEENMIFQSTYKETTEIKLHGHGYLAKYPTRRELMKQNLEVHARAQAAAREKSIAFEVEVEKLKEQIVHQAAESFREKEENRRVKEENMRKMQEEIEKMKQEFLNMLAQHKEGTLNMVKSQ